MPKQKTRRAAAKRFKVTGSGRIKCGKTKHRHLLSNRTTKMKRQSRGLGEVPKVLLDFVKQMLPYG